MYKLELSYKQVKRINKSKLWNLDYFSWKYFKMAPCAIRKRQIKKSDRLLTSGNRE